MPTTIFQNGLQLFLEANELAGADGSEVTSFTDLSGNNRHLTASSAKPLINTGAVNSKKSVIWDGTNNPLVYTGDFTFRCGWMVVKVNGAFTGDYQGILSSPENFGILTGIGGSSVLYDFLYDYYEYRKNDRIYPQTDAPAPVDEWAVVYFKFWTNLTVEGIQLGQDRDFTDRKFDGEIALLALYDRDFCEEDVRKNTYSIASSYQIALPDVFPYQGSKDDTMTISKRVLTDGQDEPVVRVKRGARKIFDLHFSQRPQAEMFAAEEWWDEFYPTKRFIYRDYQTIPPVDGVYRFPEDSRFERRGGQTIFSLNYGFQIIESIIQPLTSVPAAPVIPEDPDAEAPSVPGSFALFGYGSTDASFTWTESTDDVEVGQYEIQYATDADFEDIVGSRTLNAPAASGSVWGLATETLYFFRIRAKDTSDNYSDWTTNEVSATTLIMLPPIIGVAPEINETLIGTGSSIIAPTPPTDEYPNAVVDWLAFLMNANSRKGLSGAAGFRDVRGGDGSKIANVHSSGMGGTGSATQDAAAPGNYDGANSDYGSTVAKKIVKLCITNNIFAGGQDAATAYAALVTSVNRDKTENPSALIYVLLEIFRAGATAFMETQDEYNQLVRDTPPANAEAVLDTRAWDAFNHKFGSAREIYDTDYTHFELAGAAFFAVFIFNYVYAPVGGVPEIYAETDTVEIGDSIELKSWEEDPVWEISGAGDGVFSDSGNPFTIIFTPTVAGTVTIQNHRKWSAYYFPDYEINEDKELVKTVDVETGNGILNAKGRLETVGDYLLWEVNSAQLVILTFTDGAASVKSVYLQGGTATLYEDATEIADGSMPSGQVLQAILVDVGGNQRLKIRNYTASADIGTFTEDSPLVWDFELNTGLSFPLGATFKPFTFSNQVYNEITLTVTGEPDEEAPSQVTGLTQGTTTGSAIQISWSAATDNIGVAGYEYRIDGGSAVDAGNVLTTNVTGLTPSTEYDFEVRAYDASGNRGAWSAVGSFSTIADAFDPSDLSGLTMWLKADAITGLSNGDSITTWQDSSTANNDAAQVGGFGVPTYQTNVVNTLPVARFSGSTQFLGLPDLSALTEIEVFVVVKLVDDPALGSGETGLWHLGTDAQATHFTWVDGTLYDAMGSTVRKDLGNPATSFSAAFRVYSVYSAAGDWQAYIDGVSIFSTATNTVGVQASAFLGRNAAGGHLKGDIAEFIVYNRKLTGTERDDVVDYLTTKYGL